MSSLVRHAVYVDDMGACVPTKNWKWNGSCHMFVDIDTDLEVLHVFAEKLRLRRAWFNQSKALPHYSLNHNNRILAVKAGAIEVDPFWTTMIVRRWGKYRVYKNS